MAPDSLRPGVPPWLLSSHQFLEKTTNPNPKPSKAVILKSIKIPPIGGDTVFSNMELAWETLNNEIKNIIRDKKAIHSSLGAAFFVDNYREMEGTGNYDEYSN